MFAETKTDRWIQRAAILALLALAIALVTIGIVLYAPGPHAARPTAEICNTVPV